MSYLAVYKSFGALLSFYTRYRLKHYLFTKLVFNYLEVLVTLGIREVGYKVYRDLLEELVRDR